MTALVEFIRCDNAELEAFLPTTISRVAAAGPPGQTSLLVDGRDICVEGDYADVVDLIDAALEAGGSGGGGSPLEILQIGVSSATNFVLDPSIDPIPCVYSRDPDTGIIRASFTIFGAVVDDSANISVDLTLPNVGLAPAPNGGAITISNAPDTTTQLPLFFQPGPSGEFRLRNATPGGAGVPSSAFASVTARYVEDATP